MILNRLFSPILMSLLVIAWLGPAAPLPIPARVLQQQIPSTPPDGIDLDVTFISRAPLYSSYCVQYRNDVPGQPGLPSLCPGSEGEQRWPREGENVTFTAHVVNKGTRISPPAAYIWELDGEPAFAGTIPALAPASDASVDFHTPWPHVLSPDGQRALGSHTIGFRVDPDGAVDETCESNNSLQDSTNAMSFSIFITPEMYAAYNIPANSGLPYSAEDWLQKQIAAMNANFAQSIYPATPQGAPLRVRIDFIKTAAANPGGSRQYDGGWFVDADYRHGASAYYEPATDIDWGLVHELSHQVALIDLYAIGANAPNVLVTNRSGYPTNFGFGWTYPDLMGGGDIRPHTNPNLYSSHSAGGAATMSGYRNGYYGAYQYDIPLNNFLKILDSTGKPAASAQVAFYQRTGAADWTGNQSIDAVAEFEGLTNQEGLYQLPNRPAQGGVTTLNGHTLRDNPFGVVDIVGSQNIFLVQLRKEDHEEFFWMDITDFNLAYWHGDSSYHTFTIQSHLPGSGAPAAPRITSSRVQGDQVTLCWLPGSTSSPASYKVYRAIPPDFQYKAVQAPQAGPCFTEVLPGTGYYDGHIYVVTSLDEQGRESGFSSAAWVNRLVQPSALVLAPNGEHIILDTRNGYALLRQDAGGNAIQNMGSVHYHLENTRYMSLDANGHLLFSHPGDWYNSIHSVRVATLDGFPLLEFGQQGSGPGEFNSPAGVASWGPACLLDQPYTPDDHTLLLLHFNGSYDGEQGEVGAASGTSFAAGRFGQGVLVDSDDQLSYPAAGNLNRLQGSIEFWFQPNWNGSDGLDYGLFEVGAEWPNRIRIQKDGANNLRFLLWDSGTEYGLAYNVGSWKVGEWHHIAATWQAPRIALYVDGILVDSNASAGVPDVLSDTLYIGSLTVWVPFRAQGVIDELRISDTPRLGNSQICNRILVADSGNHRVQAFDSLGNFLSAFGSQGSGDGQFSNPQGIAVDSQGRVIVADSDNHRLVYLDFDGQNFTYQGTLGGIFLNPTGVTVDQEGWIYVADTGHNRIVRTNREGTMRSLLVDGNDGSPGPFSAPRAAVANARGDIIVVDTGNQRIVTYFSKKPIFLPVLLGSN